MTKITATYYSIQDRIKEELIRKKLNSPLGFIFIILVSIIFAGIVSYGGIKAGLLVFTMLIGVPVFIGCLMNQQLGGAIVLFISFFVQFIGKFSSIPAGIALDAFSFVLMGAIVLKQIQIRDWSFAKNPLTPYILIWIGYCLLQALNPYAASRIAWVYTVRSMALLFVMYFVFLFAFDSLKKVKWMLKFAIFMTLLAALYGLKQEFFGFMDAEIAWLYADPERFNLIVQWNRFRVFSLFTDPTTFGVLMAFMAVFSVILIPIAKQPWKKIVLLVSALLMMLSMGYGGSRTPVVMIPIGFIVYVVLTLEKKVLIGSAIAFVFGTFLMIVPTSNAVLFRIQSAFKPSGDASFQVRIDNQAFIQPYIHRHPFGGGLGSTGIWGKRFSPGTRLANFPPDSGYVRIAVELGWIGLIIYMLMLFKAFQLGVYYYLRVKNPEIKQIYLGLIAIVFMLIIASYPQEVISLLPTSIIFYITLAAIVRLKDFDDIDDDIEQAKI